MHYGSLYIILTLCLLAPTIGLSNEPNIKNVAKIAFGSCLHQDHPQPIWDAILKQNPDMFIFMGDNIYADTTDPSVMHHKYQLLANQPGYKKVKRSIPVYATWDDHDYGLNDAGAEYPMKKISQKIFQDFFQVPYDSLSRNRPGIYDSHIFNYAKKKLQIILLDTRYFRGPTIKGKPSKKCPSFNYLQQTDPDVSILGAAQWSWLEKQFKKEADIRIVVSSIQFIPKEHCWEKWSNFPLERQKMLDLITKAHAEGVILISGDRHLAEVSRLDNTSIGYSLYEVTSSGMNTRMYGARETNQFRLSDDNFREHNFGLITIDWKEADTRLTFQIINKDSQTLFNKTISIHELMLSN